MLRKRPFNLGGSFLAALSACAIFTLAIAVLTSCSLSGLSLKTPTNRYALVIGVQDYQSISDLNYPDDDARDMSTLLASQGWNVKYKLVNSAATYAAIENAMATLSADEDATILVYYSGHGTSLAGLAYILPYDTTATYTNGELSSLSNAISATTLANWMGKISAKNKILILDSCYSGGFTGDANAVDTSPADYSQKYGTTADTGTLLAALSNFNKLVAANFASLGTRDLVALSACGSNEVSWDDGTNMHGAFTYYLLKAAAANAGDADGDGFVSVAEAYEYAKAELKANWNAKYWNYRDEYGDYTFDFLPHISGGTGDIALYAPGS